MSRFRINVDASDSYFRSYQGDTTETLEIEAECIEDIAAALSSLVADHAAKRSKKTNSAHMTEIRRELLLSVGGNGPCMFQGRDGWYFSLPGEVAGDGILSSWSGVGKTPEEAINDAWDQWHNLPPNRHIYLNGGRRVRWFPKIGFVDIDTTAFSE